jgi:hypothetical protein
MPKLFFFVPPIGIGPEDDFYFDGTRPARHCGICGESFQPYLARTDEFLTDGEVQLAVQIELEEWRRQHNNTHSEAEHVAFIKSGRLMTPEAALKLIPLGVYPVGDMALEDEEIIQAGLEAKRAPFNDVPDFF